MSAKKPNTIFVFRISLSFFNDTDDDDCPYRVIAVPEGTDLQEFARIIVSSFEFDFDHAFGFYDNLKNWTASKEGYEAFADMGDESRFPGVKNTFIENVYIKPGKKMLFLFDYGDEWHFFIELTALEEPVKGEKYPKLMESVGDAPPRDELLDKEIESGFDDDVEEYDEDIDDSDVIEAEERIRTVLGAGKEADMPAVSAVTLKIYHDYLKKSLSLPFKALYYNEDEDKESKITVTELLDFTRITDESRGLLCACTRGKEKIVIPLAEIEPDDNDPNYRTVDDYCFWYWEYL